ncbi:5-formyltetrahydrofolate cyclo-ligase [Candidatus Terasakiella magnetica]|nr:5-formyltetrahydrofolate cyclo-ligase [Candidatus Terasakiella magnetica]
MPTAEAAPLSPSSPSHSSKTALRAQCRRVRAEAAARLGPAAANALPRWAASLGKGPGARVAGYWPLGDEIDPRPLMLALHAQGCPLCLPVVLSKAEPLLFRAWSPDDALEAGPHGTQHPSPDSPCVTPDIILVPLLAFDEKGFRLGYGGGYYDRTLAALRRTGTVRAIGLAFAAQKVGQIPAEPWDQPLEAILTEAGLNWCQTLEESAVERK